MDQTASGMRRAVAKMTLLTGALSLLGATAALASPIYAYQQTVQIPGTTSISTFAGTQGSNNDIAGPNGISISNFGSGKLLIVGDGPSSLQTFNLDASG